MCCKLCRRHPPTKIACFECGSYGRRGGDTRPAGDKGPYVLTGRLQLISVALGGHASIWFWGMFLYHVTLALALLIGLSACRSMHSADADAAAAPSSGCVAPARPDQFPDSADVFLTTANLRLSPANMVGGMSWCSRASPGRKKRSQWNSPYPVAPANRPGSVTGDAIGGARLRCSGRPM